MKMRKREMECRTGCPPDSELLCRAGLVQKSTYGNGESDRMSTKLRVDFVNFDTMSAEFRVDRAILTACHISASKRAVNDALWDKEKSRCSRGR